MDSVYINQQKLFLEQTELHRQELSNQQAFYKEAMRIINKAIRADNKQITITKNEIKKYSK